jgi:hypothetical protein
MKFSAKIRPSTTHQGGCAEKIIKNSSTPPPQQGVFFQKGVFSQKHPHSNHSFTTQRVHFWFPWRTTTTNVPTGHMDASNSLRWFA